MNRQQVMMDAAYVQGMIESELMALVVSSREVGRHLIFVNAHGALAAVCAHNDISEQHGQLLIDIAEREATLRHQGIGELEALQSLVEDRKLLNELLTHTAQMVKGAQ